ncbi:hypothetical protein PF001_g7241 [Phytophthora fragariae]|uniref:Uncharacterized protein n=1 Tax=Phytophthora fragariae TaxID=53985 RepID=A0A6A4E3X8_9STRA|nr:hypothetical protein PF001_g7241 [Phytophthora fragariae]
MSSGSPSPITGVKAQIQIDPNNYDIELADVAVYLKDCNGPWGIKDNSNVEGSALPGLGNKTHSWMGMRWCYHLPRSIYKIVANPVPIPPTGVPSGWPSWTSDQDEENDAKRLCDILCQLRCWDSKKSCYILVCEFYVPWERSLGNGSLDDADETYEPGSFGELMSQWFDDDMEQTRYRAKLLDFGSRARTLSFNTPPSSDNWELRWRSPLQTEQESENKQKRLVVNALLASSLQVNSTLDSDAYQRVVAGVTLPEVKLSVTHVGATNDTHDIITAELNDTVLSCAVSGSTSHTRMLNLRASSAMQVYLDNMAQLLTVSVIPRTTIDAMIESSSKGLEISTLIGPVSVYLNQTSILVLSAIPKLLQSTPKFIEAHPDDNFSSMRIRLVNLTGGDICSALLWKIPATQIKENAVTGRYFDGRGFLWICVELKGLQTIVTLRSPLTFRNFCDFPVRVRISDGQLDGLKKSQCSFAVLHPGDPEEPTKYVWVKVDRAQCKTVLPTDFDPLQPQVSRRYTWMGVSLWPAITVENSMDIPVSFSFFQKDVRIGLNVHPSSEKSTSALNPFEPMDVQFLYEGHQGSSHTPTKPIKFSLVSSAPDTETKEQIFEFGVCRVVATVSNDHRPTMRIRTERALSVANMTPSALRINIDSPLRQHGTVEKVASCEERSVGFSVASKCLVVSIATDEATRDRGDEMEWSPEITLNVNGDTKPVVVPPDETGLRSLASAYCVELANRGGYLKLTIRPQVVVINSTSCNLKFTPTDGRGNSLAAEDELSLLSGEDEGWSVPVCLHKEAKKRSITADVSSWLSSKLSRRPSTDLSNPAKQALVARVSCSFRVSLAEDGYEWTEEIAVLLPKIPLLLSSDGKLKIVEPQTSSTTPPNTPECLYPAPSTTTHRRRLLIRHRDFCHKMLTYTMTQTHKCIHIMFFVDHQAPVIIHNQWENVLGFRNVAFPSDPEGVGSNYYLEYDWGLQVPTKQQALREEDPKIDNNDTKSDTELLRDWLEASMQSTERVSMPDNTSGERMRFQIGSPRYGWSNALWQVGGIQFASFFEEEGPAKSGPTFLVMCFYRAGSWLISITCLEDPTHEGHSGTTPSLVLPSMTIPTKVEQAAPVFLKLGVIVEELSLHFCDEHDPVRDARGLISYPEILRATCNAVSIVFATAPDPPEVSRHSTRLGYLSHIRSYTTLFVGVEDIEVGHFLRTCNFPVILCFTETHGSKDLLQFDRVKKHEGLANLMGKLLDKQLPGADKSSLATRIIYTDTWDPVGIPSYFHSIELKLAPAVLQVEDDILTYMNAFIRPMLDALEGEAASARVASIQQNQPPTISKSAWSMTALESAAITKQRKVYIERLEISTLQVTITARVSIPVLNSFDGTPLHFGSTEMREVFAFPDQLYKDLAADYVADTIVRSPMLLMSLNIIGNPAGFVRSFGQGVRDLVEIPLAASRNGYSPWVLTKGVVGGVASFLGHATAATLTSVSGFSYSFSRTMDQLTLPSDQLKKRHYTRPTQLSSALASGLGSLGSSVVGAAAGVITTPIAVYKERQMQGLDNGLRSVVGGVGMGLVGIVARPMGGVASLVSMTSDGLLYGMGGNRAPFDDSVSRFNARQNELLRYKLKVLPDVIGSSLAFAHGVWVVGDENKLVTPGQEFDGISEEQLEAPENEALQCLVLPADRAFRLVQVTVVCSNECLYVVGMRGAQNQAVLVRTSLESIQAVEESLKEPTIFDLGVKTPASVEWLRFRLPPRQRRHLSHQLRLWLANDAIL